MRRLLSFSLVLCLAPAVARAEPSAVDRQAAQSLFDSARRLMKEGKYAEACGQFEQSQKLDPGGGTLLNLATCHEKQGRLATAYAEYNEALSLAIAGGRADRQKTASDAIAALEQRLPKLRVIVGSAPPDLVLTLDDQPLPRAVWGIPTPFDPGKHRLAAHAPGHRPFAAEVELREAQTSDFTLPPLAPEAILGVINSDAPPLFAVCNEPGDDGSCGQKPRKRVMAEREVNPPLKTLAAAVSVSAGVAAAIFGVAALGLQAAAKCSSDARTCESQESLDRARSARKMAWYSTLSTGGAVLGGVAYFLIPTRKVQIEFGVAPTGASLSLAGRLP